MMVDFAIISRESRSSVIFPLSIVQDDEHAERTLQFNKELVTKITGKLEDSDVDIRPVTRIDINIPTGISRTVKEMNINKLILGWSGKTNTANYFFGNIVENLLESCRQMMIVSKFSLPVSETKNIYLFLPAHSEKEQGFTNLISMVKSISMALGAKLHLVGSNQLQKLIQKTLPADLIKDIKYILFEYYPNISPITGIIQKGDLVIAVAARASTISYNRRLDLVPKILSRHFAEQNYVIMYPEQTKDSELE